MKLRRRGASDRTTIAAVAAVAAWFALGGRLGAGAALVVFCAVQFPSLLSGLRPTGRQRDSRPAAAAVAAAAAVIVVAGGEHLGTMLLAAAAAAVVVWAWPTLRRGAHHAAAAPVVASRRNRAIRGNHHGRPDVIEEVPSGRVGISRKRGGDGPTQIELCARYDRAGQLVRVAERRHVHARWRISSRPAQCPIDKGKRHWRLRAVGRATRTR